MPRTAGLARPARPGTTGHGQREGKEATGPRLHLRCMRQRRPRLPAPSPQSRLPACPGSRGSTSQRALRLPRPRPARSRPPPEPCLPPPRRAQEGAMTQLPAPETAAAAPPPGARAGRRGSTSSHARPPSRPRLPAPVQDGAASPPGTRITTLPPPPVDPIPLSFAPHCSANCHSPQLVLASSVRTPVRCWR